MLNIFEISSVILFGSHSKLCFLERASSTDSTDDRYSVLILPMIGTVY